MAEQQPPEGPTNSGAPVGPSIKTAVTKRQRRPSVRLGDIGGETTTLSYYSLARRTKQWHDYKHKESKGPKARAAMNSEEGGGGGGGEFRETLEGEDQVGNCDGVAIGSWKARDWKSRRGPGKRARSNWVPPKMDACGAEEGDNKFGGVGEGMPDGYHRDFEADVSESPVKERSPRQSSERRDGNEREVHYHGKERPFRARVSEGRDNDADELEEPSDTDARDWKCGTSMNGGGMGRCQSSDDGIRIWLDGLGLGRYAPFFEIHEVDDEVLPMLTLEDLKDMGINAVGSRRKMFCAIQKLGKGFS